MRKLRSCKIEILVDQFRYIKIQPNTTRGYEALGNKPHKLGSYSPEPRTEIYCFRLNFDISKFVYLRVERALKIPYPQS